MVTDTFAFIHAAEVYSSEFRKRSKDLEYLDTLFDHVLPVLDWLKEQVDIAAPYPHEIAATFLNLMIDVSPYLQARSLHSTTLKYIPACLQAAANNPRYLVKINLIAYHAHFMFGQWQEAKLNAQAAVFHSKNCPSCDQALAYQALAILQQNSGDFKPSLDNFARAKLLFKKIGDKKGEFDIISQEAAYYVDHERYTEANKLYTQVEEYEITCCGQPSGHTLLMIGVVSRRLKMNARAIAYLQELARRGMTNPSTSDLATALHHMAWVFINQGDLQKAWEYGKTAARKYQEINDLRGTSDADEQLGEIARLKEEYETSACLLKKAIQIRQKLANKVGLASAYRRLSKTRFRQKKLFLGGLSLIYSGLIYLRMGVLTKARIKRWLHEL